MFVRALVLALAFAVLLSIATRASHGSGAERSYVVRPGDTLWAIAAARYGGDPRKSVWEIMKRNGLRSSELRPGQALRLP